MILAALMLATVQDPPSPAQLERLSPAAAGELVLAGQEHGPIESVDHRPPHGMDPPGYTELQLVERAVAHENGCARQRWHLVFIVGPDGTAVSLSRPSASIEVALLRSGACPQGDYVQVNSRMELAQAFAALGHLEEIRSPRSWIRFSCSDTTSSHLCSSPQRIRRELGRISPWAVMREGDTTTFWLGVPGDIVTDVRYHAAHPDHVEVKREIPAPF